MKTSITSLGLLLLGLLFVGCHRPHPPVQPPPQALFIDKSNLDLVWDETLEVLREHYFIPDRQDRRAGLIVTRPTVSKQWFEFWRDDAQGTYEVAESSIHTIRRTVRVRFQPIADKYEIRVAVQIQRKNEPARQMTTASGVALAFRDRAPAITGQVVERTEQITWVDVGEDLKLANYLLGRLERRIPEAEMQFRDFDLPK